MEKLSVRPTIDLRSIRNLIIALSQRLATLTLDNTTKTQISNMLNAIRLKVDELEPIVQKNDDPHAPAFWRKNRDYCAGCKTANIKGQDLHECPFGLPITDACNCAGKSVDRMSPLSIVNDENKKKALTRANKLVYIYHKTGESCPYADKVLDNFGKVDCDFGDTGQRQKSVPYRGSPLYPQTFNGIGLDGLHGYPLGYYGDNQESRNLFFGLFSFLGSDEREQLVKLADKCDSCGNNEVANMIDEVLQKAENPKSPEEFEQDMHKIERFLDDYREQYEDGRTDAGLMWELFQKWFGLRHVG